MVHLVASYPRYQYYYRSPGVFFLHQTIYFAFQNYGLSSEDAIAISSSTAGGVFVCVLFSFSLNPLFLLINLYSGIVYIFMGHLENYGWVNALLALFFLWGTRYLKGQISFVFPIIAWICASFMHMLAIFYFPALVYLFIRPSIVKSKEAKMGIVFKTSLPSKKEIEQALILLILFLMLIIFIPLLMKDRVIMLDVGGLRIVPIFKITNPRHYFTMFSIQHFKMMFYFISQASIIGIPLLIILIHSIKTKSHIFILIGFICGFLWAFIWHPDMGYGDWDLFGSFAIPLNLLCGILISEKFSIKKMRDFLINYCLNKE